MTCRFANDCTDEGRTTVRIHGVGDRRVCDEHLRWMAAVGMDYRVLPTQLPVPEWRQRSLARSMDRSTRLIA